MALPDTQSLDRDGQTPIYLQVATLLRDHIDAGRWPEHYRLPSEPFLAEDLGVSRGTLRKALDILMTEGRLSRVQGRGTFVNSRTFDAPFATEFSTISEELDRRGIMYNTEVLVQELIPAPSPIAALLNLRSGETILRLERLRSDEDGPIAYLVNFVRIDGLSGIGDVDFNRISLFEFLEVNSHLEIDYGQRTISAVPATDVIGARLNVQVGHPVLYLEQVTYLIGGTPIEYSDIWVNPERMRIGAVVRRRNES